MSELKPLGWMPTPDDATAMEVLRAALHEYEQYVELVEVLASAAETDVPAPRSYRWDAPLGLVIREVR